MWDVETEIVIVDAGGCGLMAAFVAARAGAEVVLLDKSTKLGCNTALASGSIPAAGTRFQRALGIDGTPEQMADDVMRKNHAASTWYGIFAPAGTPAPVVARLSSEVGKVVALPEIRSALVAQGVEPLASTPEQYAAFLREEHEKWGKVIRDAGIKIE